MKRISFILFIFFYNTIYSGTTPFFLITPNILPPSSMMSGDQTATVYQVTNNTATTIDRTFTDIGLALMPSGATPNTSSVFSNSDYCSNPFTLTPGQSCLVKVNLIGSGL